MMSLNVYPLKTNLKVMESNGVMPHAVVINAEYDEVQFGLARNRAILTIRSLSDSDEKFRMFYHLNEPALLLVEDWDDCIVTMPNSAPVKRFGGKTYIGGAYAIPAFYPPEWVDLNGARQIPIARSFLIEMIEEAISRGDDKPVLKIKGFGPQGDGAAQSWSVTLSQDTMQFVKAGLNTMAISVVTMRIARGFLAIDGLLTRIIAASDDEDSISVNLFVDGIDALSAVASGKIPLSAVMD